MTPGHCYGRFVLLFCVGLVLCLFCASTASALTRSFSMSGGNMRLDCKHYYSSYSSTKWMNDKMWFVIYNPDDLSVPHEVYIRLYGASGVRWDRHEPLDNGQQLWPVQPNGKYKSGWTWSVNVTTNKKSTFSDWQAWGAWAKPEEYAFHITNIF